MRRLLIALTTVLAACVLASPAFAANPIRITDPTGDAAAIPDIVGVTIEDSGAAYTFTIELATLQNLQPDALVLALINSDRNGQTGGLQAGIDFAVAADKDGAGLLRWNGTTFEPVNESIQPSLSNGQLGFTITKTTIASQKIDVIVLATTDSSDNVDAAPDLTAFTYLPTITRLVVPPSVLVVRAPGILNARTIRVQMTPAPSQTVTLQPTLRCTLTFRGRVIRPMAGGCRWRIPRSMRGRRLTLRVVATVGTESRTQTMTVRVR